MTHGAGRHGSGGVGLFARSEWRSHWRAHALITTLVAATMAVVIASLVGASRSQSAYDRLREATHASDVAVGGELDDVPTLIEAVGGIPGVSDARHMVEVFVRPAGSELFPDYTLLSMAPAGTEGDLDTAVITDGRAPHPDEPHEIAINAALASALGVEPGDVVPLESLTDEWVDTSFNGGDPGPPDGPTMDATVTGIARSPAEFGRWPNVLHLTPAFIDTYRGQLRSYDFVHVAVADETLDAVRRSEGALPQTEGSTIPLADEMVASPSYDFGSTREGLDTIATSLRLLAGVAAAAGVVAVGLALSRAARASSTERDSLLALGWTRTRHMHALLAVLGPWLAAGVAAGTIAGLALSPHAMVGLAEAVDPRPQAVLADGTLVALAVVTAAALLAFVAWLAARGRRPTAGRSTARGTPLAQPIGVAIGVRHALFGPAERGGRTSRAALLAVTGGVAAAIAALVVSGSIERLAKDPSLFGSPDLRIVDSGEAVDLFDEALPILESDERVAVLAGIHVVFELTTEGISDLPAMVLDVRRGQFRGSVVSGRPPTGPDEVALGPASLDATGADVGDEIELAREDESGDRHAARYRIVGAVLFPEGDFSHDEGAMLTVAGAEPLIGDAHDTGSLHQIAFQWADRVDPETADAELAAAGIPVLSPDTGRLPAKVTNLAHVEGLPRYLALFVGMLCLATLAHATWVGVGVRAHELSTLRALGTTRGTTATIVWSHALVIVLAAVALGVPAGIVIGQQVWRSIAESANVVVASGTPWIWVAGAVAITATVGAALAAAAAARAVRVRPAVHLRAE